mmetsp:Transcript_7276/g.16038  ORF Transcript_7276/g.16038 Transcript_7276/m.16038 type:complete len:376 (-) Transcript_7276:281-1408(-)
MVQPGPSIGRRRGMGFMGGALGFAAVALLVCAAVVAQRGTASPEQTALAQLWETPYATRTTMLWNAADDSQGSGHWGGSSDSSSSYTQYDTFGHSGGDSDGDSDGESSGSSSLASSWGHHSDGDMSDSGHDSSDGGDGDDSDDYSTTDDAYAPTTVHSWDSSQNVKLKSMLKKMYHQGIDKVSKSVAAEAEKQATPGFFGKWAKLAGKKISGKGHKKYGLSSAQAKLYKDAEASEVVESKKKRKFAKAADSLAAKKEAAAAKLAGKKVGGSTADRKRRAQNHIIKAADKLAENITRKKKKAGAEPAANPGVIGSKSAVHDAMKRLNTAHGANQRAAAQKKMVSLEAQIKSDFSSVTEFAHKVKTSLPPKPPMKFR